MSETENVLTALDRLSEALMADMDAERARHSSDGASPAVVHARVLAARSAARRQEVRDAEARRVHNSAVRARRDAAEARRDSAKVRASVCGSCFTVHAGDCF